MAKASVFAEQIHDRPLSICIAMQEGDLLRRTIINDAYIARRYDHLLSTIVVKVRRTAAARTEPKDYRG